MNVKQWLQFPDERFNCFFYIDGQFQYLLDTITRVTWTENKIPKLFMTQTITNHKNQSRKGEKDEWKKVTPDQ